MKAAQLVKYGEINSININESVLEPTLSDDKILVEIQASSINPFDFFIINGFMKDYIKKEIPFTIGGDFSGRITKVGKNVSDFKISDEVFGTALILSGGSGAFAEVALVDPKRISYKPKNINYIEAASLPLVSSSVVQAIEDEIKLKPGQKILIHGGAGGIGSVAIQLSKYLKAYVTTTVSEKDVTFVKNLGADEVIDYRKEKFEDRLKEFDAVFDTVGGEITERSFKVLKRGGIIVSMKGQPNMEMAKQYGVVGIAINTKINTVHLDRVRELVERGIIKPQIDKIFPLHETKEAFVYKQNDHPRGKVVIKIK